MERRQFLTAAAGLAIAITAARAALGDTVSVTDPTSAQPMPGQSGNPCMPLQHQHFAGPRPRPTGTPNPARILESAERRLSRIIEALQRDQDDYSGHKESAIGYMQQAQSQLQEALQSIGGVQSTIHS